MTTAFIKDIEPFFHRRRVTYVDVGAHKGAVFRQFAKSDLSIREAHLIEPNPQSFAILERAAESVDGVRLRFCHNLALGDAEGTLRMRDADSMTQVIAGLRDEGDGNVLELAQPSVFEVRATTLDALSATFERRHVSLLKIDVEGYELPVLAGAEGLLRDQAIDMVYIEAGMSPDSQQQSYYRSVEDALAVHGYRLFRLYEQTHEWPDDNPLLRRLNMAFMSARFATENPYRLSQELFHAQKQQTLLGDEVESLQRRLKTETSRQAAEAKEAEARLNRLKAERERERAEHAAEKAAYDQERAARETAAAALAEATARVAALEAELAAVAAERRAWDGERQRLRFELETLQSYSRQLEQKHVDTLQSSSWRALAPARSLVRVVTGRKPPKPFAPRLLDARKTPKGPDAQPAAKTKAPPANPASAGTASAKGAPTPISPLLDKNLYLNKINDIIHSRAGGAREFIPFEIVKPAARSQTADDRSRFVFAIPLASRQSASDWDHTLQLLEQTLTSVTGQSDPDWTAIIAGHEPPDIPAMADPRIEFVSIDRPPPSGKNKFRADKSAKRHVLGRRLAQMGGGYFMQLDADDLVRDDLVATVRSGGFPNGGVSARGYALDYVNRRLAPVPGVWRQDLHNVCGSCSVVHYAPEQLPTTAHKNNDQSLVFNMTRQHAYTAVVMEELGRPLEIFAEPMVVYLVNHVQSLSFSLQKSGSRGDHIVREVERHALERDAAAAILTRFGLKDYL